MHCVGHLNSHVQKNSSWPGPVPATHIPEANQKNSRLNARHPRGKRFWKRLTGTGPVMTVEREVDQACQSSADALCRPFEFACSEKLVMAGPRPGHPYSRSQSEEFASERATPTRQTLLETAHRDGPGDDG